MNFNKLQSRLDRTSKKAIYIQIADEIIEYIKKGIFKVGEIMPSTRQLAAELSVNRNTVVQAFDILISEGWLVSEERKKTYVSDKIRMYHTSGKKDVQIKTTEIFRNDLIFFDDGLPDTTYTPIEELARAYRRIFSRKAQSQIMNLASELGDEKFRETISIMLNQNRSIQTSIQEVCITRGSQMALFLAAHCILEKGDIILIENPGYSPAWSTFRHAGATMIPIDVDDDGVRVDMIEEYVKVKAVKAVYLTPHHQYPTTVTLSLARRLQLIELSNKYGFTIIEDDYDNEYHFDQRPIMPISSFEGLNNYVYIGTLSKLIAPAVRIGYIVSNQAFITQIGKLRKIVDLQGDAIMEQSILDLIISGDIRRHQKRMFSHYQAKRDFFATLLDKYLKSKVVYKKPDGGLAFWLKPINNINLYEVKDLANSELISFYTPDRFSFETPISGIRIGYASLSEDNLEKGIRILSKYL